MVESYDNIRNKLVLTRHSKDNYHGNRDDGSDRSDITIHQIVMAIQKGRIGFCGHKRFKKDYGGIRVIYKVDNEGNYVVITYYHIPKRSSKKVRKFS